ncbi:MAG: toprim domain-containing protein [Shewanella sp.]|nr:toprim domain-containing protein [Shewanella sp.]
MNSRDYAASVKATAAGQWPVILQELAGLDDQQVRKNKKTPCPLCGGSTRYSFKDPDNGYWACGYCRGGDGFTLLMKLHDWSFMEAVGKVGAWLGMDSHSEDELARIRKASDARRKQQAAKQKAQQQDLKAAGIADARRLWASAGPYREHPYAIEKRFSQRLLGLCRQHGGWLLVPMLNGQGELVNVQRFAWRKPEGEKRLPRFFVKGAPAKGSLLCWGPDSFTVMITEGVADADACYQLEHCACRVVVAFCASQLPEAARWVRLNRPESQIIVCPDNDDAGRKYGEQAAREVAGCLIATPPPPDNDWSDHFLSQSSEVAL